MTGPQRYPGASTAYFYQSKFGGSAMNVNVVVLHTTEGRSLPDYGGGAVAPTLTAVPDCAAKQLRWYQHFNIDTSARALVNLKGGVETNTLNVCQVELVGTCDPATRDKWVRAGKRQNVDFIFWPEAPEWALAEVAVFLRWMHVNHGVPLSGPKLWPAYPKSYGSTAGQRMSFAQWTEFSGVCGHMHVPENTHGDPGSIDFARLIALAHEDDGAEPPAKPPTTPTKPTVPAFPGRDSFKPGAHNKYVTQLGQQLVRRGYGRFYQVGPGPKWGEADRLATQAFQRAQGWTGKAADGYPGPETWKRLFS